jgi:hypothetical protein
MTRWHASEKGEKVLKKLLFVGVVVLMVVLISVPTLAQVDTTQQSAPDPAAADPNNSGWGSEAWFRNQFGVNGDISGICNTIGQNSATEADWTAQYPDLPQWCQENQQSITQQAPPPAQQGTAQYAQYAQ